MHHTHWALGMAASLTAGVAPSLAPTITVGVGPILLPTGATQW